MCRLGFIYIERKDKKNIARTILITAIAKYYLEDGNNDGVGIAFVKDGKLKVIKDTNIATIFHYLGKVNPFNYTNLVIFHTRKATSGRVTSRDAHPFLSEDKKICLVHNGFVYSYDGLKEVLESKGHKFQTQVDSEVLLHTFEEFLNGDKELLRRVDAYGTFLILTKDNKLYFATGNGFKLFKKDGVITGFSDSSLRNYLNLGKQESVEGNKLHLFSDGSIRNLRFKVDLVSYISNNNEFCRVDQVSEKLEKFISRKLGVNYQDVFVYFNSSCSKAKIWVRGEDKNFKRAKKFFNLNSYGYVIFKKKTLKKFLLKLCENEEERKKINEIFLELESLKEDMEIDKLLERYSYYGSSGYGFWGY